MYRTHGESVAGMSKCWRCELLLEPGDKGGVCRWCRYALTTDAPVPLEGTMRLDEMHCQFWLRPMRSAFEGAVLTGDGVPVCCCDSLPHVPSCPMGKWSDARVFGFTFDDLYGRGARERGGDE